MLYLFLISWVWTKKMCHRRYLVPKLFWKHSKLFPFLTRERKPSGFAWDNVWQLGAYIGNFIFWRKKIVESLKVLLFICTFWQIQIRIGQMRKYTYPFRQIQLLVLEDAGWVGGTQDAAAATVGVKSRTRARECVRPVFQKVQQIFQNLYF